MSDIVNHPHREVIIIYYETCVRYYPLLKKRPDLLQNILGAMTGSRGLQHENARVRSRCCYLLLRLVKSVGSKNPKNNVLRPYVEIAVSGLQGILEIRSENLRLEDMLYLFETIGLFFRVYGFIRH